MKHDPFNAASAASQLVGSLEGTRNFHWHHGDIREAIRINKVLVETLQQYAWSDAAVRWLDQYKQDQVQLNSYYNEITSAKANP